MTPWRPRGQFPTLGTLAPRHIHAASVESAKSGGGGLPGLCSPGPAEGAQFLERHSPYICRVGDFDVPFASSITLSICDPCGWVGVEWVGIAGRGEFSSLEP